MHRSAIQRILILLLFSIVAALIYSNTLEVPFYFDDVLGIVDNPSIRIAELSLQEIGNVAFGKAFSQKRPVGNITFALNYYFHQYRLQGYHIVNIIIHLLSGIFLYLFIITTLSIPGLMPKYDRPASIAFFAALVWLVHPIHTQSVTYIIQRLNSMAAMFYMLSFWLYVKGRLAPENAKRWPWYSGSALAGILALGSKENAAMLPFFIFLYEWYFFQNLDRDWLKRHLKYVFGVVFLFGLIALVYLGTNPFEKLKSLNDYAHNEFTLTERVLTQFRVVIYYLSLLAYPHPSRLNLDYDFPLSHSLIDPVTTLLCLGAVIGFVGLAVYTARRERLISFCILWFFGNLLIESSVIPLAIIFEHRTYLPSMLVCLLAVLWGYRLIKIRWLGVALICFVAAVFSLWTYQRNNIWRDPVALWSDCVKKSPQKARPHNNLGTALDDQNRTQEAIDQYLQSLRIKPDYLDAHYNLGNALDKQGHTEEAIDHYLKVLQIRPDYEKALNNLGAALDEQGRTQEAVEHYLQALRIKPDYEKAHYNLGNALDKQGRTEEAIDHYLKALQIKPDYEKAHYNLGNALAKQGRTQKAIDHYLKALQIKSDNADVHFSLGIVLYKQDRTQEAIDHYLQALSIEPEFIEALSNLALVYMLKNKNDKALSLLTKLTALQPDNAGHLYNLACIYSRQNQIEESLERLKKAVEKGYDNWELIKSDKDLINIRGSADFKALIKDK